MLLHRQLRWMGHVFRMIHSRLSHCVLHGHLRLGRRSVGGQSKRFKYHIKSIHKKCNIPFIWRISHPKELPGDQPVPLECHSLTMNTIVLQLSDEVADISILQCSAQFRILIIIARFVADNAYHALVSSATARPNFNVEEEVAVTRD